MNELQPCPFCGSRAPLPTHTSECYFTLKDSGTSRSRIEAAWNQRHFSVSDLLTGPIKEALKKQFEETYMQGAGRGTELGIQGLINKGWIPPVAATESVDSEQFASLLDAYYIATNSEVHQEAGRSDAYKAIVNHVTAWATARFRLVSEDTERLDFITTNEVGIRTLVATIREPLTDGSGEYRTRAVTEGWLVGISDDPSPTPRACIDVARGKLGANNG